MKRSKNFIKKLRKQFKNSLNIFGIILMLVGMTTLPLPNVEASSHDTEAPSTTIGNTASIENSYFNGNFHTFGTASDTQSSITAVRVIFDNVSGPNHTFTTGGGDVLMTPTSPTSVDWEMTINVETKGIPDGEYLIKVRAMDSEGNLTANTDAAKAHPIYVDTTAPDTTIDNPSDYENEYFNGNINLTGTATDNLSGIKAVRVVFDNVSGPNHTFTTGSGHVSTSATGANSVNWEANVNVATEGIPDGEYLIKIRAMDNAGNLTANAVAAKAHPVYVDTTAPATTINNPSDFENEQFSSTFTITGTATDALSGVKAVRVIFDPISSGVNTVLTTSTGHVVYDGSSDWTATVTPGTDVPDGEYAIKVRAMDFAGNLTGIFDAARVQPVILDTNNPVTVTPLDSPEDGSFWNSPINIEGSSSDENGVDYVNLYYRVSDSGDPWTFIDSVDNPDNDSPFSNWSYDWTPTSEGTYDIKAAAVDNAGNEETSAFAYNVTYDVTNPGGDFIQPELNETESGEAEIKLDVEDNASGVKNIQINIYDDSNDVVAIFIYNVNSSNSSTRKLSGATYSFSGDGNNGTLTVNFDSNELVTGNYHARAFLKDNANNSNSAIYQSSFYIDNTAPNGDFEQPELDEVESDEAEIKLNVSDVGSGVKNIQINMYDESNSTIAIFQYNVSNDNESTRYVSPADYTYTGDEHNGQLTVKFNSNDVPTGEYHLRAFVKDGQNNSNSAIYQSGFFIDNSAPNGDFVEPSEGQVVSGSTIEAEVEEVGMSGLKTLQVVMRNDAGQAKGNWLYNVQNDSSRVITGNGTIDYSGDEQKGTMTVEFDSSEFSDGKYNLRFFIKDNHNNGRSNIYRNFWIDNTAPSGQFTEPNNAGPFNDTLEVCAEAEENGQAGLGELEIVMRDSSGSLAGFWIYNVETNQKHGRNSDGVITYTGDDRSGKLCIEFNTSDYDDDMYNFRFFTKDQNGNANSAIYLNGIEFDNTAPAVAVDNQTTTDTTPTVTGTYSDANDVTSVDVTIDGTDYTDASPSSGTWSVNVTNPLSPGTYDVMAVATDEAGNDGSDTTTDELTIESDNNDNNFGDTDSTDGDANNNTNNQFAASNFITPLLAQGDGDTNDTDESTEDDTEQDTSSATTEDEGEVEQAATEDDECGFWECYWWVIALIVLGIGTYLYVRRRRNEPAL